MEEIGTILLLGMLVAPTGLAFAWTVQMTTPDHDDLAMTYCGDHPFQEPYCRAGHPVEGPEPGTWCGPLTINGHETGLGGPVACVHVDVAILVREPSPHTPGAP